MEIKEFRNLVNKSELKDTLNELELNVSYSHLNFSVTFKGIQSIFKFVQNQIIGWNSINHLPSEFVSSKLHFEHIRSLLVDLVTSASNDNNNNFNFKWSNISNTLSSSYSSNNNRFSVFLYDCPETDFIVKLYENKPEHKDGALDYILKKNLRNINNEDYFSGVIAAYEFKNQSGNEVVQRRNNEKKSISQIRSKFEEHLVEAEQHLNSYLSDTKDNLIVHFETVDKLKTEKNKNFEDWFTGIQSGFDTFFSKASDNIKTNEDLYKEKLRLEAPAEYWKVRAVKLKKEGQNYLNWLIRISVIAAILLFTLLILLGTDYFNESFKDSIKGIKWSVILITIVSLLAFTIKILSKMTFSSFHLSRDAEEREQLTHFYLALKKDTTIEPEERQLILQSLFSRADTGLLKEDSSPTMPSSIIEKFAGNK
jgi:uncharacterized Tic20 family protein